MTQRSQPVVWVLVADGEHARVVVPAPRDDQFATSIAFDPASARLHADAAASTVDRRYEAVAPGHHAEKPARDPEVLGEQGFAVSVAQHVSAHALRHDFDQLELVAPARTLHHLREALPRRRRPRWWAPLPRTMPAWPIATCRRTLPSGGWRRRRYNSRQTLRRTRREELFILSNFFLFTC